MLNSFMLIVLCLENKALHGKKTGGGQSQVSESYSQFSLLFSNWSGLKPIIISNTILQWSYMIYDLVGAVFVSNVAG